LIYGTVLCLGDSLTFGARSDYVRGYPEELARMLSDHLQQEWTCLNYGINGETSIDILRRAFTLIHSFAALPGAKLACLMAGTNDSKNPDWPVDLYKDNLRQIIRIFRRENIKLLLGTLPPVKGNTMPCFDSKRSNQWIQEANLAIEDLIKEYDLILVDFSDMAEYLIDGVHFGYRGYMEMARRWFDIIKEL
jgi:lysophospholipase L1-like esterase